MWLPEIHKDVRVEEGEIQERSVFGKKISGLREAPEKQATPRNKEEDEKKEKSKT